MAGVMLWSGCWCAVGIVALAATAGGNGATVWPVGLQDVQGVGVAVWAALDYSFLPVGFGLRSGVGGGVHCDVVLLVCRFHWGVLWQGLAGCLRGKPAVLGVSSGDCRRPDVACPRMVVGASRSAPLAAQTYTGGARLVAGLLLLVVLLRDPVVVAHVVGQIAQHSVCLVVVFVPADHVVIIVLSVVIVVQDAGSAGLGEHDGSPLCVYGGAWDGNWSVPLGRR